MIPGQVGSRFNVEVVVFGLCGAGGSQVTPVVLADLLGSHPAVLWVYRDGCTQRCSGDHAHDQKLKLGLVHAKHLPILLSLGPRLRF